MMTGACEFRGIVLRFGVHENLSSQAWEILLDQLRSEHIPGLYQNGKKIDCNPGRALV